MHSVCLGYLSEDNVIDVGDVVPHFGQKLQDDSTSSDKVGKCGLFDSV